MGAVRCTHAACTKDFRRDRTGSADGKPQGTDGADWTDCGLQERSQPDGVGPRGAQFHCQIAAAPNASVSPRTESARGNAGAWGPGAEIANFDLR